MKKYKALIIDLDGTLIQQNAKDGLPTKRVKKVLEKAHDRIHIGIATGRPPIYAYHLFDHLELSGPSIFLNGALIVNSIDRTIMKAEAMNPKEVLEVIKIVKRMDLHFTIDETDAYAMPYIQSYQPKRPLAVFVRNMTEEQVKKLQQTLSHMPTITSFQVPDWSDKARWGLHIGKTTASKQHAIVSIAKILKISPKEIIAIGDSYNDFPLLMACGLKVAMGNAVDELKAIADYIAPSIEDDGVADVIERFVL